MNDLNTKGWRSQVDRFLFSPVNGHALAWFRILIAISYPYFFWSRGKPSSFLPENVLWIYEHLVRTSEHKLTVLALCGLLFMGWHVRFCSFALCLVLFPLCFVTIGEVSRPVFLAALLAFSFTPSGTVRFPWENWHPGQFIPAGPCWPIRLMQILLTLVYGINALAKTTEIYLRGETLMDMSVTRWNFVMDLSSGYLDFGFMVMPIAVAAILSVLTEYILAIGFWFRRWKWAVALLGVAFHIVLSMVVKIFMLHYASMFLYLTFLMPLVKYEKRGEWHLSQIVNK